MSKMDKEEQRYSDLRVMTLKRLYAPFSVATLSEGKYVSLDNYHFIDILPVSLQKGDYPITKAYQLRSSFGSNMVHGNERIHVIQNILLFGNRQDFWVTENDEKTQSDVLYITMVHLSGSTGETSLEHFEDKVRTACRKYKEITEEDWCVYYALDFCDALIFARRCSFDRYQEVLWDLTVRGNPSEQIAVDTISLYGIRSEKVKIEFENFANGRIPKYPLSDRKTRYGWDACFDLSLFLSVQNGSKWSDLQRDIEKRYRHKLNEFNQEELRFFRKFGRTDISAMLRSFDLENALYVVWLLIQYELPLDHCRIVPLSQLPSTTDSANNVESNTIGADTIDTDGRDAQTIDSASNCNGKTVPKLPDDMAATISALYEQVCPQLETFYKPLSSYFTEIYLSLQALLKSHFTEEYSLSVLPSFVAHLMLVGERLSCIEEDRRLENGRWIYLSDRLIGDLREYYRCLMLLEHATIHGEKRFIQAPGLNAFIYEVPAKLLTFYTAVAFRVIQSLRDKDGKLYVPVLIPDFRQDMYSHSLSDDRRGETQVGIIYLEERLFYEPQYMIPCMIHEIAHKVGDIGRLRGLRLRCIFNCLSKYLLATVLPEDVLNTATAAICSIAESLSSFFSDAFSRYADTEEAFLEQINMFMEDTWCGEKILREEHDAAVKALSEDWKRQPHREDIGPLLREFGFYYQSPFQEKNELNDIEEELFFSSLLHDIWTEEDDEAKLRLKNYCDCLTVIFSEAYSDVRMLEITGYGPTGEPYHALLKRMFSRKNISDAETIDKDPTLYWRHAAVCDVFGFPIEEQEFDGFSGYDAFIIKRTREELTSYLSECHRCGSEKDVEIANYVETGCNDIVKIREEIARYKKELQSFFIDIMSASNKKTD